MRFSFVYMKRRKGGGFVCLDRVGFGFGMRLG